MGRSIPARSLAALAARAHWLTVEWLPKYAPELNEIEPAWRDLKAHHLAHQTFADVGALDRAIHYAIGIFSTANVPPIRWPGQYLCLGLGGLLHRLDLLFHWLEGGSEHGGGQLGDVRAVADSGFNPSFDQPLLQLDELRRAFHCGQRLHRSGQVLGILSCQFLIRPGQLLNSGSRGIAAHGQNLGVALHDFLCCFAALGWRLGGGFGNLLTDSSAPCSENPSEMGSNRILRPSEGETVTRGAPRRRSMMGERRVMQEALFYGFSLGRGASGQSLVAQDRFVDLSEVRAHLGPNYSDVGRPWIDAE